MAVSSLEKAKQLSSSLGSIGKDSKAKKQSRVNHSQYAKKVELHLYTEGLFNGPLDADQKFTFPVNPEDFTLNRQERVQVVQTLGEPFIDEYGRGLPTLTIRGTTGWRMRPTGDNLDGHDAFLRLHREFLDRYFSERQYKIDSGLDPNDVNLVILNNVDDLSYNIVPQNFRLLRNKNKPLLYQYEITFVVINDLGTIEPEEGDEDEVKPKSENWLTALTGRAEALIDKVENFASPICNTVAGFIDSGVTVLENVKSGVADVANFINGVSSGIEMVLNTVRNTQAFINDLPIEGILELNELTSVLSEFNCYLQNGIKESWLPDFSGVCGVSNCATTHGIKPGKVAGDPSVNAIQWIAELRESANQAGTSNLIGIRHTNSGITNNFEEPKTVIIVQNTLDEKLSSLNSISKDPTSVGSLDDIYKTISSVIDEIDIDASRLEEKDSDALQKINQFKTVTVKENDSLQLIAYREYGTMDRWHEIAAANDIVVESPGELLAPMTSITASTNLFVGTNKIDIGMIVPTNYAEAGAVITIKDVNGAWQCLIVKAVNGSEIEFHGTFSQNYTGPLTLIRNVNLADLGMHDGKVSLTADFNTGAKKMYLSEVKDIYAGYTVYVQGTTEARSYSVVSVNYIEKSVLVNKSSIGFSSGATVLIYNTETRQMHIIPGTILKIPITTGDQSSLAQTASEVFGCDIKTSANGAPQVKGGDFVLSMGLENLQQAIKHRILSKYGSLLPHPKYGCGLAATIGEKNTPAAKTLAKASIVEALNREPRLSRIARLDTFSVGDGIKFTIKVAGVDNNTTTDLNFVIGGDNVSN